MMKYMIMAVQIIIDKCPSVTPAVTNGSFLLTQKKDIMLVAASMNQELC
jgi:hypothetical protein